MPILNTTKYGQVVFLPQQPESPMTEILEWATDVFTAHDGSEQRIGIRDTARQRFEMTYPINASDNPRAINALFGGVTKNWIIGIWSESQTVSGLAQGVSVIPCAVDHYRFKADDFALMWASPTQYTVVEIAAVLVGGLQLKTPLDKAYGFAYLTPMRSAQIRGTPERTTKGHDAKLSIAFDLLDNSDLSYSGDIILFDFYEDDWTYAVRNDRTDVFPTQWTVAKGCFGQEFFTGQPHAYTYVSPGVGKSVWMQRTFPGSLVPNGSIRVEVWADDGPVLWFNGVKIPYTERPQYLQYFYDITDIQETNTITIRVTDSYDSNGSPAGNPSFIFAGMRISTGQEQFLGDDIYYTPIETTESGLVESTVSNLNLVDYESGVTAAFHSWLNPKLGKSERAIAETPSENRNFKNWLRRRAGKLKQFWRPTFERDFRLISTGLIGSSLIVRDDDYNQFGGIRKHIAIKVANGQWFPRTITSHVGMPNNQVQLNLDTPLNIQAKDVDRISYLGLHRLNTDRIETVWASGIATTEFTTTEIKP